MHCAQLIRPCDEGPACMVRCLHYHPVLEPGEYPGPLQLSGPKLACKGWVHAGQRDGWHLCDPFTSHTALAGPIPRLVAA
jgi:hypothetical protein